MKKISPPSAPGTVQSDASAVCARVLSTPCNNCINNMPSGLLVHICQRCVNKLCVFTRVIGPKAGRGVSLCFQVTNSDGHHCVCFFENH